MEKEKKGNSLNQYELIKDGVYNYIRENYKYLWFVEFPDSTWLREDKLNFTINPKFALPFINKESADIFIRHYRLNERLDACSTEHLFI